jgi:parallel beta-helix repeat protein
MRLGLGVLVIFALSASAALADCEEGFSGMVVTKNTVLCSKQFDAPDSVTVKASNVVLDCNGAIIRGTGLQAGQGIVLEDVNNVTVKNCNVLNFDAGIYIKESNRNTIIHNAFLKNKVGMRMLEAFENRFEGNADKSTLKPVSAIASKFNTIWLTNKDLDRDFCETNLCNTQGVMNPCVHDDHYCSPYCSHETDNDCSNPLPLEEFANITEYPALENESAFAPKPVPAATPALEFPAELPPEVQPPKSRMILLTEKTRFWATALLFIVSYLITFLLFQHHHRHH